ASGHGLVISHRLCLTVTHGRNETADGNFMIHRQVLNHCFGALPAKQEIPGFAAGRVSVPANLDHICLGREVFSARVSSCRRASGESMALLTLKFTVTVSCTSKSSRDEMRSFAMRTSFLASAAMADNSSICPDNRSWFSSTGLTRVSVVIAALMSDSLNLIFSATSAP